jgi:hypothetical protein
MFSISTPPFTVDFNLFQFALLALFYHPKAQKQELNSKVSLELVWGQTVNLG